MVKVVDILVGSFVTFVMKHGKDTWREIHFDPAPWRISAMSVKNDGVIEQVHLPHFFHTVYLPWRWLFTIPPHLAGEKPSSCTILPKFFNPDWTARWRAYHDMHKSFLSAKRRIASYALPEGDETISHCGSVLYDYHIFMTASRRWQ